MVDMHKLETALMVSLIEKSGQDTLTLTDKQIQEMAGDKYVECHRDFENKTYTISIKRFEKR
jgi:hypothetical protein